LQGLTRRWSGEAIKAAELVACNYAPLAVHAEVDPRALLGFRHGVDQFHLKSFWDTEFIYWCRRCLELGMD